MTPINNMREAELKHEFRSLYREMGEAVLMQAIYECIIASKLGLEVLKEETLKDSNG